MLDIPRAVRHKYRALVNEPHKLLLVSSSLICNQFYHRFHIKRTFTVNGKNYPYLYHPRTYYRERCIEVPFVQHVLGKYRGRVLEVGNVLHWYQPVNHDVVDKYETGFPLVLNEDILDFCPEQKYDIVVSISTFEHIGMDYGESDERMMIHHDSGLPDVSVRKQIWSSGKLDRHRIAKAVTNVRKQVLSIHGVFIVTMPLGYNSWLDLDIEKGNIVFDDMIVMKRLSRSNRWVQIKNYDFSQRVAYDKPFPGTNWLLIGVDGF